MVLVNIKGQGYIFTECYLTYEGWFNSKSPKMTFCLQGQICATFIIYKNEFT